MENNSEIPQIDNTQLLYGPAPVNNPEPVPAPPTMPVQLLYGPAPVNDPEPVPAPPTMPVQLLYGPAPVNDPEPVPAPQEDTSSLQNSEDENLIAVSSSENFEDVISSQSFIEETRIVSSKLEKLHSNSFYVKGIFGDVLSSVLNECKMDIVPLREYNDNNLLKAMYYVSEYDKNYKEIEEYQKQLSNINKNEEMELFSQTNDMIDALNAKNQEIKKNIEKLENEKI